MEVAWYQSCTILEHFRLEMNLYNLTARNTANCDSIRYVLDSRKIRDAQVNRKFDSRLESVCPRHTELRLHEMGSARNVFQREVNNLMCYSNNFLWLQELKVFMKYSHTIQTLYKYSIQLMITTRNKYYLRIKNVKTF